MNHVRLDLCRQRGGRGTIGLLLTLAFAACGADSKTSGAGAKAPAGARTETLEHEDCPEGGNRVDALDTNGDGKADIKRVFDKGSGHELCRIVDLNHDGKPDLYEYFDAAGTVRRREFCYDDTGVVNAVEHYENGKLARREYDADGQYRVDTWDFFDTSVPPDPKTGRPAHPARRERDTTGDGHVNQWWTWNGNKVTIAVDSTGDGKPDPESALVLGESDSPGATPPASADSPSAPPPVASTPSTGGADGGKP
jgi:hypothetical protein